ncbi:hypothetical protein [Dyella sp.]|uniref:hypothetical protein n=1 Tax=Dyella sp. TaxID=1869338 RepID=UPI00284D72A3|nr:hypothetical protein [Dyella sp.]MDR3445955.1 hypothetical protein [Dyella sp.]
MSAETQTIQVTGEVSVTPEMLAAMFWEMDASKQADFFAELDRIAGLNLCFQMAGVVQEIQERVDHGDHRAQLGFQTMLAHAQGYGEGATDYRVWRAQREIQRMTQAALDRVGSVS